MALNQNRWKEKLEYQEKKKNCVVNDILDLFSLIFNKDAIKEYNAVESEHSFEMAILTMKIKLSMLI